MTDYVPRWHRILIGGRLPTLAAGVTLILALAGLAAAPTITNLVQAAAYAAWALYVARARIAERPWIRAANTLARTTRRLNRLTVYLDRDAHMFYITTRTVGSRFLYAVPEDQIGDVSDDDGGVLTAVCYWAPRLTPHLITRSSEGAVVVVDGDGLIEVTAPASRPRVERVRGRWLALRTGAAFPSSAELDGLAGALRRVERFEPPEDEEATA